MIIERVPGNPDRRAVAMTFDDGPSAWTDEILDALAAADARATFFVLGERIEGRERTLARAVREGHELGNHTFTHRRASSLSDDDLASELRRTSEHIESFAGRAPLLVRPPYGDGAGAVDRVATHLGLATTVLWSIDTNDWAGRSADAIVKSVADVICDGAIVLLHDGFPSHESPHHTSRAQTVEAVRMLVPWLVRAGYRLVTVSELLLSSHGA